MDELQKDTYIITLLKYFYFRKVHSTFELSWASLQCYGETDQMHSNWHKRSFRTLNRPLADIMRRHSKDQFSTSQLEKRIVTSRYVSQEVLSE